MVNYRNSIIYKLCCRDPSIKEIYIGSTTNFNRRKQGHKVRCCNLRTEKSYYYVYRFIRENGGWENWQMVQIEQYMCADKRELEQRERYWIDKLNSELNKCIPTRTKKEYYEANKDKIIQKVKEYREANKDTIRQKKKEYREANKDKIKQHYKEYREANKDTIRQKKKDHYEANKDNIRQIRKEYREANKDKMAEYNKAYREVNKDKLAEYNKQYYEANKDRIKQHVSQKLACECGSVVTQRHIVRHKRTKKHRENMQSLDKI